MMADFSYLIPLAIIGFIGLVVGALVGFLASGMRDASRRGKQKRNRDLVEVVRIWHDRRSGGLTMEIGGKFYKKVTEFNDKSRRGFVALINEMQSWSGVPNIDQRLVDVASRPSPAAALQPTKTTSIASDEGSRSTSSAPTVRIPTTPVIEKVKELKPIEDYEKIPATQSPGVETTDIRIRPSIVEKSKDKSKEKPEELKSIAAQVDEILQEKLAGSSHKNRVVRLLELPDRGMVVIVDGFQYDGVGEVSDPEVRQMIQESVAEWERRMRVK